MVYRICKSIELESGHLLSKHPGNCKFPHGHTRSVEMTVMRLRDKLGAISASPLETLRSQGYRWNSSFVS